MRLFLLAEILTGDVFQVGAQEDQAAGALFTFGGTEAGLSAADLAFADCRAGGAELPVVLFSGL